MRARKLQSAAVEPSASSMALTTQDQIRQLGDIAGNPSHLICWALTTD
jgi:hypothetical protein